MLPSRTVAKKSAKDQEHPARRAAAIAAREAFLAPNPARCRTTKRKVMDVVDSQGPSNSAKRHQPNAEAVAHLPFHPAAIETAVNIDNDACSAQLSPEFIESAYNVVCAGVLVLIADSDTLFAASTQRWQEEKPHLSLL